MKWLNKIRYGGRRKIKKFETEARDKELRQTPSFDGLRQRKTKIQLRIRNVLCFKNFNFQVPIIT